jgi:hypothetical protein
MTSVPGEQLPSKRWWLFGPKLDLWVFLGSAVLSVVLLGWGFQRGWVYGESPEWSWVCAVLLVDVAHVWSTGFRTYFDPTEIKRRPGLYLGTPLLSWIGGVLLYSFSSGVFWSAMAYLAVWHFIRQQYGWVVLYRRRCGEFDRVSHWIDSCTIYLATLFPLAYWHAHLPRQFWWFVTNDFRSVPGQWLAGLVPFLGAAFAISQIIYWSRSVGQWFNKTANPGKDMVVATTTFCWFVGIVALNSDYAFTVTNVLIHGVPYMALVYCWQKQQNPIPPVVGAQHSEMHQVGRWSRKLSSHWIPFVVTLWALAYCEEMFWDRAVWHERGWLFGSPWDASDVQTLLVPLLAVPQISHYVLDGFIWKRRHTTDLAPAVQN